MRDSWTGKEFFQKSFSQLKENNREEIKMKTKDALKESSIIDNTQQKK